MPDKEIFFDSNEKPPVCQTISHLNFGTRPDESLPCRRSVLFVNFFVQQILMKSGSFRNNFTRATTPPIHLYSLKMFNVRIMKGLIISVSILFKTGFKKLLSAFSRRVLSRFCHIYLCLLENVRIISLPIYFHPKLLRNVPRLDSF